MLNEQLNLDDNDKKELLRNVKRKTPATKRGHHAWKIEEIDKVLRLKNSGTKYKFIARNVCRTTQSIAGLIFEIKSRTQSKMSEIVELDSYKRMMGTDIDDAPKPAQQDKDAFQALQKSNEDFPFDEITSGITHIAFFTGENYMDLLTRLVNDEIQRLREYLKNV